MKSLSILMLLRRPERRDPQRRRQRGVALIESLVSILIFSFGVLGLIGLEASAINYSVDAEDRNRAALFASDIASSMWLNNTVTVTPAQYATWQANIANTALPTGLPNGTLTITATAGTTNSADISIQWTPNTDKTNTTRQLTTRVIL
jgi:type IV pilus assembly protein PilV